MSGSKTAQEWVTELITNDRVLHLGAQDVINTNLSHGFGIAGAAEALRDLMLNVLYADPDMYKGLAEEFTPGDEEDQSKVWYTRAKVTRAGFGAIDFEAVLHAVGDDEVIDRHTDA